MKRDVVFGIAVFVIIMAFGLYLLAFEPAAEVGYRPLEVEEAELIIPNQLGLNAVEVERASIPVPGFISIHESLSGAPAAPIASSQLLAPGVYEDIIIDIESGLNPQLGNVALLLADDGDGVYEPGIDLPLSVSGEVVRVRFEAIPE
jgi:hypothetical protein